MSTPAKAFYDRQLALLLARDVEALIAAQYHDDAVLLGNNGRDFVVRCAGDKQPLVDHFRAYLEQLGSLEVLSTDRFVESGDEFLLEATVRTGNFGVVRVYDAFVLSDGKARVHFTGLFPPPAPQA